MATPDQVLEFWLGEVGPKGWYDSDPQLDQTIRDRFLEDWETAQRGGLLDWQTDARRMLGYIILTDQFPRNMFRGDGRSFATDRLAIAAAKHGISCGWDMKTDEPERQFYYMPLMHSENLCDQERCVRLMLTRMPKSENNLLHARAHREIIRRFGRFPYRNDALGRRTKPEEEAFLEGGGYGACVRELQQAA